MTEAEQRNKFSKFGGCDIVINIVHQNRYRFKIERFGIAFTANGKREIRVNVFLVHR